MKLRKVDIKFIQDDIVWNKFDKGVVLSLSNRLKVNNISFDVIINSSVKANTNSQWIDSANGNLRLIFDLIKKNQIGVVFQSWNKYPDKIIPEWSLTHLSQVVFFEKLMQLNSNGTQNEAVYIFSFKCNSNNVHRVILNVLSIFILLRNA
jgi:hypothetical protein